MLTSGERERIEARLQEERRRIVEALREFDEERATSLRDDTGELTLYRLHPADIGSEMMEQEQQFSVAAGEGRRLQEVDDALRRLYSHAESVGVCQHCGKPISMERLQVVPWTQLCAECQSLVESRPEGAEPLG